MSTGKKEDILNPYQVQKKSEKQQEVIQKPYKIRKVKNKLDRRQGPKEKKDKAKGH